MSIRSRWVAVALLAAGGLLAGAAFLIDGPAGSESGAAAADVGSGDGEGAPDPAEADRSSPASTPVDPQRLKIPALGIDAPVSPVTADGLRLIPPSDPQTVGWWSSGAKPGAERGTAILAGHTVSTGGGVFDDLDRIRPGQRVLIRSDDGRLRLRVRSVNVYSKEELAERAGKLFDQTGPGRVALVTCEDWTGEDYLSNVVVMAVPIG